MSVLAGLSIPHDGYPEISSVRCLQLGEEIKFGVKRLPGGKTSEPKGQVDNDQHSHYYKDKNGSIDICTPDEPRCNICKIGVLNIQNIHKDLVQRRLEENNACVQMLKTRPSLPFPRRELPMNNVRDYYRNWNEWQQNSSHIMSNHNVSSNSIYHQRLHHNSVPHVGVQQNQNQTINNRITNANAIADEIYSSAYIEQQLRQNKMPNLSFQQNRDQTITNPPNDYIHNQHFYESRMASGSTEHNPKELHNRETYGHQNKMSNLGVRQNLNQSVNEQFAYNNGGYDQQLHQHKLPNPSIQQHRPQTLFHPNGYNNQIYGSQMDHYKNIYNQQFRGMPRFPNSAHSFSQRVPGDTNSESYVGQRTPSFPNSAPYPWQRLPSPHEAAQHAQYPYNGVNIYKNYNSKDQLPTSNYGYPSRPTNNDLSFARMFYSDIPTTCLTKYSTNPSKTTITTTHVDKRDCKNPVVTSSSQKNNIETSSSTVVTTSIQNSKSSHNNVATEKEDVITPRTSPPCKLPVSSGDHKKKCETSSGEIEYPANTTSIDHSFTSSAASTHTSCKEKPVLHDSSYDTYTCTTGSVSRCDQDSKYSGNTHMQCKMSEGDIVSHSNTSGHGAMTAVSSQQVPTSDVSTITHSDQSGTITSDSNHSIGISNVSTGTSKHSIDILSDSIRISNASTGTLYHTTDISDQNVNTCLSNCAPSAHLTWLFHSTKDSSTCITSSSQHSATDGNDVITSETRERLSSTKSTPCASFPEASSVNVAPQRETEDGAHSAKTTSLLLASDCDGLNETDPIRDLQSGKSVLLSSSVPCTKTNVEDKMTKDAGILPGKPTVCLSSLPFIQDSGTNGIREKEPANDDQLGRHTMLSPISDIKGVEGTTNINEMTKTTADDDIHFDRLTPISMLGKIPNATDVRKSEVKEHTCLEDTISILTSPQYSDVYLVNAVEGKISLKSQLRPLFPRSVSPLGLNGLNKCGPDETVHPEKIEQFPPSTVHSQVDEFNTRGKTKDIQSKQNVSLSSILSSATENGNKRKSDEGTNPDNSEPFPRSKVTYVNGEQSKDVPLEPIESLLSSVRDKVVKKKRKEEESTQSTLFSSCKLSPKVKNVNKTEPSKCTRAQEIMPYWSSVLISDNRVNTSVVGKQDSLSSSAMLSDANEFDTRDLVNAFPSEKAMSYFNSLMISYNKANNRVEDDGTLSEKTVPLSSSISSSGVNTVCMTSPDSLQTGQTSPRSFVNVLISGHGGVEQSKPDDGCHSKTTVSSKLPSDVNAWYTIARTDVIGSGETTPLSQLSLFAKRNEKHAVSFSPSRLSPDVNGWYRTGGTEAIQLEQTKLLPSTQPLFEDDGMQKQKCDRSTHSTQAFVFPPSTLYSSGNAFRSNEMTAPQLDKNEAYLSLLPTTSDAIEKNTDNGVQKDVVSQQSLLPSDADAINTIGQTSEPRSQTTTEMLSFTPTFDVDFMNRWKTDERSLAKKAELCSISASTTDVIGANTNELIKEFQTERTGYFSSSMLTSDDNRMNGSTADKGVHSGKSVSCSQFMSVSDDNGVNATGLIRELKELQSEISTTIWRTFSNKAESRSRSISSSDVNEVNTLELIKELQSERAASFLSSLFTSNGNRMNRSTADKETRSGKRVSFSPYILFSDVNGVNTIRLTKEFQSEKSASSVSSMQTLDGNGMNGNTVDKGVRVDKGESFSSSMLLSEVNGINTTELIEELQSGKATSFLSSILTSEGNCMNRRKTDKVVSCSPLTLSSDVNGANRIESTKELQSKIAVSLSSSMLHGVNTTEEAEKPQPERTALYSSSIATCDEHLMNSWKGDQCIVTKSISVPQPTLSPNGILMNTTGQTENTATISSSISTYDGDVMDRRKTGECTLPKKDASIQTFTLSPDVNVINKMEHIGEFQLEQPTSLSSSRLPSFDNFVSKWRTGESVISTYPVSCVSSSTLSSSTSNISKPERISNLHSEQSMSCSLSLPTSDINGNYTVKASKSKETLSFPLPTSSHINALILQPLADVKDSMSKMAADGSVQSGKTMLSSSLMSTSPCCGVTTNASTVIHTTVTSLLLTPTLTDTNVQITNNPNKFTKKGQFPSANETIHTTNGSTNENIRDSISHDEFSGSNCQSLNQVPSSEILNSYKSVKRRDNKNNKDTCNEFGTMKSILPQVFSIFPYQLPNSNQGYIAHEFLNTKNLVKSVDKNNKNNGSTCTDVECASNSRIRSQSINQNIPRTVIPPNISINSSDEHVEPNQKKLTCESFDSYRLPKCGDNENNKSIDFKSTSNSEICSPSTVEGISPTMPHNMSINYLNQDNNNNNSNNGNSSKEYKDNDESIPSNCGSYHATVQSYNSNVLQKLQRSEDISHTSTDHPFTPDQTNLCYEQMTSKELLTCDSKIDNNSSGDELENTRELKLSSPAVNENIYHSTLDNVLDSSSRHLTKSGQENCIFQPLSTKEVLRALDSNNNGSSSIEVKNTGNSDICLPSTNENIPETIVPHNILINSSDQPNETKLPSDPWDSYKLAKCGDNKNNNVITSIDVKNNSNSNICSPSTNPDTRQTILHSVSVNYSDHLVEPNLKKSICDIYKLPNYEENNDTNGSTSIDVRNASHLGICSPSTVHNILQTVPLNVSINSLGQHMKRNKSTQPLEECGGNTNNDSSASIDTENTNNSKICSPSANKDTPQGILHIVNYSVEPDLKKPTSDLLDSYELPKCDDINNNSNADSRKEYKSNSDDSYHAIVQKYNSKVLRELKESEDNPNTTTDHLLKPNHTNLSCEPMTSNELLTCTSRIDNCSSDKEFQNSSELKIISPDVNDKKCQSTFENVPDCTSRHLSKSNKENYIYQTSNTKESVKSIDSNSNGNSSIEVKNTGNSEIYLPFTNQNIPKAEPHNVLINSTDEHTESNFKKLTCDILGPHGQANCKNNRNKNNNNSNGSSVNEHKKTTENIPSNRDNYHAIIEDIFDISFDDLSSPSQKNLSPEPVITNELVPCGVNVNVNVNSSSTNSLEITSKFTITSLPISLPLPMIGNKYKTILKNNLNSSSLRPPKQENLTSQLLDSAALLKSSKDKNNNCSSSIEVQGASRSEMFPSLTIENIPQNLFINPTNQKNNVTSDSFGLCKLSKYSNNETDNKYRNNMENVLLSHGATEELPIENFNQHHQEQTDTTFVRKRVRIGEDTCPEPKRNKLLTCGEGNTINVKNRLKGDDKEVSYIACSIDKNNLPPYLNPKLVIHDIFKVLSRHDSTRANKWSERQFTTIFDSQCPLTERVTIDPCSPFNRPRISAHKSKYIKLIQRYIRRNNSTLTSNILSQKNIRHQSTREAKEESKRKLEQLRKLYDAVSNQLLHMKTRRK